MNRKTELEMIEQFVKVHGVKRGPVVDCAASNFAPKAQLQTDAAISSISFRYPVTTQRDD